MTQLSLATALMDSGKPSATSVAKPSSLDGRPAGKPADTKFADVMDAANTSTGTASDVEAAPPEEGAKDPSVTDQEHQEDPGPNGDVPEFADADAIQDRELLDTAKKAVEPTVRSPDAVSTSAVPTRTADAEAEKVLNDTSAELKSLHGSQLFVASEVGAVTPHTSKFVDGKEVKVSTGDLTNGMAGIARVGSGGNDPKALANQGVSAQANSASTVSAVAVQSALSQSDAMLDTAFVPVGAPSRGSTEGLTPNPGSQALSTSPEKVLTVQEIHADDVRIGAERALQKADAAAVADDIPAPQSAAETNAAAKAPAAALATATQALSVQSAAQALQEKEQNKLVAKTELEAMHIDLRGSSNQSASVIGTTSAPQQPGLARHLAFQIADAMRANPDRPIELALSPKELGTVRLTISAADGNVALHVVAERPETLDLMRRNSEALLRDLGELGFTSIDLAFGQGGSAEENANDESAANGSSPGADLASDEASDEALDVAVTPAIQIDGANGLDIRI